MALPIAPEGQGPQGYLGTLAFLGTVGTLQSLPNIAVGSFVGSIGSPIGIAGGTVGTLISQSNIAVASAVGSILSPISIGGGTISTIQAGNVTASVISGVLQYVATIGTILFMPGVSITTIATIGTLQAQANITIASLVGLVATIGTLVSQSNIAVASLVGSIGSPVALAGGTVGTLQSQSNIAVASAVGSILSPVSIGGGTISTIQSGNVTASVSSGVLQYVATIGTILSQSVTTVAYQGTLGTILSPVTVTGSLQFVATVGSITAGQVSIGDRLLMHSWGYRDIYSSRNTNDVYDVCSSQLYYVANDRDLYATIKEVVTYNRPQGNRVAEATIGCDCSLDMSDDGTKVLYYDATGSLFKEAPVPSLTPVSTLFGTTWTNAIVKYDPANPSTQILIGQIGGTVVSVFDRVGTCHGSITGFLSLNSACLEKEDWVVADRVATGPARNTIYWYQRSTGTLLGIIPNIINADAGLNIHNKTPFTTIGNDQVNGWMVEQGGVPARLIPYNSGSYYPILGDNSIAGTYFYSIYEIPMWGEYDDANPPMQPSYYEQFTLGTIATLDFSVPAREKVLLNSTGAITANIRIPVPVNVANYARIFTTSPARYVVRNTQVGQVFEIDVTQAEGMWGNIQLINSATVIATIDILVTPE